MNMQCKGCKRDNFEYWWIHKDNDLCLECQKASKWERMVSKIKHKGKEYAVLEIACKKRNCFVPFSGNGTNICRLYELGKCPEDFTDERI